ncbi:probable splicing factor, arginine/serine-rich 7 [Tribolium castaneum]|uniref:Putative splicing factor, arginine/serine-rich 7-like Protein n=1 Tax=Tribolium castaneum TaxID=7070 RepID=D6WTE3_TRICA|nr:PREDICTED: probable splicing factor, arginine/serine-rich 7 [Tribolium castaneum]EFA06303.1 putative splicing factor, arginine/serine-rich 7-like Protein [Tribolium castaneum]|eukprot:XP_973507.1 PREDICTED: probable splicing factor, arginine/serine-rich 7 [Tribolium castaneum]
MVVGNTKVVQVTNIAPQATKDQMQTLFGYLGKIEDIRLYPTIRDVSCPVQSRICYVKFVDSSTVGVAQHMTNTVFIDRALIVIPVINGDIPDEYYALEMTRNGTIVPGFNVNEPKLPPHVSNSFQGTGEERVVVTNDPHLTDNGCAPYPPLPAKYDSIKVEETRRTVQVVNIDPAIPTDEIIQYFSQAGEVKYLRVCECPNDNTTHILIEFTEQPSVVNAMKMNGEEFKGKPLEIIHATQPIMKPQAKSNEAAQKEIEEAMSRFKEAQNMINASIEPVIGMLTKDKRSSRRSRSRSRGRRRRSRSRSLSRGSRSRRRRSTSRSRRSRSRDRRKRSKSRSRKRSVSRTRRSRSRERRSRSKSKGRSRPRAKSKTRDRSKDRKRDKDRKSKERDRKSKERDKKEKDKKESSIEGGEKKVSRSRSRSHRRSRSRERRKEKERRRSRSKGRRRTPSPSPKAKKRSRSKSRDRRKEKKKKERSRSKEKVPRNYDEEEKGFDSERDKEKEREVEGNEKGSEKSDNMDISNSP